MFRPVCDERFLTDAQGNQRQLTNPRAAAGTSPYRRRLRVEPLEDRRLLATITVDTLVDGTGIPGTSLREAIAAAAANDTINFSVTGTISLTSLGQLTINKNLTISGPGANLLTIQAYNPTPTAGNGSRVFNVDDGTSTNRTVAISGLTLTGGDVSGDGGAIRSLENLTVANSTISGSAATGKGGGIFSSNRNLTVTGSTISGNSARYGGGITCSSGTLTVTGSTISGNAATTDDGGGVYSFQCPVTITSSTISGNSAQGDGGGIFGDTTTVTVTSSTVSGNSAYAGGGIYSNESNLTVTNSTISGNQVTNSGGGIYGYKGNVTVTHSTITANRADSDNNGSGVGGGVRDVTTGTEAFRHTILALNTRGAGTRSDGSGPIELQYSLIGDNTGATINNQGGNQIGTGGAPINPLLGPLANNGGPTMTHALLAGSLAIDAGNAAAVAGAGGVPLYDQRGTPYGRVTDGDGAGGARIDIGAFEVQLVAPALPGDYNVNSVVDAADYVLWRKTQGATGVTPYNGADGSGNGAVGPEDYGVWRANYGKTAPSGAGSGAVVNQNAVNGEQLSNRAALNTTGQFSAGTLPSSAAASEVGGIVANAAFDWDEIVGQSIERQLASGAQLSSVGAQANSSDDALLAWLSSRTTSEHPNDGDNLGLRGGAQQANADTDMTLDLLDDIFASLAV